MNIKIFLYISVLFISISAYSQYGYPDNRSMGGVDRTIDRQRNAPRTKNKKAYEKKDPIEIYMQQLEKRLKLDSFQKAAISEIFKENKDALLAVSQEDSPLAVREDKIREITEKIDARIIILLSKEQNEEYKKIIEERKQ